MRTIACEILAQKHRNIDNCADRETASLRPKRDSVTQQKRAVEHAAKIFRFNYATADSRPQFVSDVAARPSRCLNKVADSMNKLTQVERPYSARHVAAQWRLALIRGGNKLRRITLLQFPEIKSGSYGPP